MKKTIKYLVSGFLFLQAAETGFAQCDVIYATTNGTGSGTKSNPTSLYSAVTMASSGDVVRIAQGTYFINSALYLEDSVTYEGGFIPGSWNKTSQAGATTIIRSTSSAEGVLHAQRLVAIYGVNKSGFRIQDLTIRTSNALTNTGMSTYGVHLTGCSNYVFVRTQIFPGNAARGTKGANGASGSYGGDGGYAGSGSCDGGSCPGSGWNGGAGGNGGAYGGSGGAGIGRNGGSGGRGGDGGDECSSNNAQVGSTGQWVCINSGSAGGSRGQEADPGGDGGNAGFGYDGYNGSNGAYGSSGLHAFGFWQPGGPGANGTDGCGGNGGGGGGGGARQQCTFCNYGPGNGGGGGGGGGQGGAGGQGSRGGGASFAVYLYNNGTNGKFFQCSLQAGIAGTIQPGGTGGTGGRGGYGRSGSAVCIAQVGQGGFGGDGGDGGDGGNGGNGAPGISMNLFQSGIPVANSDITSNFATFPVITWLNQSCAFNVVTFKSPTAGAWNFGGAATPVAPSGSVVSTTYSIFGRHDVIFNSNSYSGFVHMSPYSASQASVDASHTVCVTSSTLNAAVPAMGTGSWTSGGSASVTSPTLINSAVTGLVPGENKFYWTVKNGDCCPATTDTLRVHYDYVSVSATSGSICEGDSFTITPAGAATYSYSSGSAVVNPQNLSSYTVTGTSAFGCTNSAVISVSVSPAPVITVNSGSICSGDAFTIAPSGAATYTVQGGNTIVSPLADNSYTVTGTSTAGCQALQQALSSVTVHALPGVAVNSGTICAGETFTIVPTGANSYSVQGGNFQVSPLTNASYSVLGISPEGCVSATAAVAQVAVNILPSISVNSGSVCAGETFTIVPAGAGTYTIEGGSAFVSPAVSTSYTVTGTSNDGCVAASPATVTVVVNSLPVVTVNSGAICPGESFTIVPSGADTYTVEGGSTVVSPSGNTSYTVAGTSTAGCASQTFATCMVTINVLPVLSVNSGSVCAGETFTIVPSGANTYTIEGGSSVVNPTSSTSYSVIGTSAEGCMSQSFVTSSVTVHALPLISASSGSVCAGESFTVTPSGAASYTIEGGSFVVSPSVSAQYSVVGESAEGCIGKSVLNVTVTVGPLPHIQIASEDSVICEGETVQLTASGGTNYTWHEGSGGSTLSVQPVVTTTYTVKGEGANGCFATAVFSQVVDPCTGLLSNHASAGQMVFFPNPNKGNFRLEGSDAATVVMLNQLGQAVATLRLNEDNDFSAEVSGVAKGLYYLKATIGTNVTVIKMVVTD